jgi:hypothetical protein
MPNSKSKSKSKSKSNILQRLIPKNPFAAVHPTVGLGSSERREDELYDRTRNLHQKLGPHKIHKLAKTLKMLKKIGNLKENESIELFGEKQKLTESVKEKIKGHLEGEIKRLRKKDTKSLNRISNRTRARITNSGNIVRSLSQPTKKSTYRAATIVDDKIRPLPRVGGKTKKRRVK